MPYVPPHKRNDEWSTITRKHNKAEKPKKKEYVEEYPSLNKELEILPRHIQQPVTKPTLSTLFRNSLNRKQKKKIQRIKPGWVLLTKNGILDSLNPKERKAEDEAHEERMYLIYLEQMIRDIDSRDNYRREYDHTYLWEWERTRAEFDKFDKEDDDSEYYSETETDIYDEDYEDELDLTI